MSNFLRSLVDAQHWTIEDRYRPCPSAPESVQILFRLPEKENSFKQDFCLLWTRQSFDDTIIEGKRNVLVSKDFSLGLRSIEAYKGHFNDLIEPFVKIVKAAYEEYWSASLSGAAELTDTELTSERGL